MDEKSGTLLIPGDDERAQMAEERSEVIERNFLPKTQSTIPNPEEPQLSSIPSKIATSFSPSPRSKPFARVRTTTYSMGETNQAR